MNDAPPGSAELLAALPVAVLALSPDGRIAQANAAAEHLLNLSERAMRGQPLDAVVQPPAGRSTRNDGRGFAAYDAEMALTRGGRVRVDFVEAALPDAAGWRLVALHQVPGQWRPGAEGEHRANARSAAGAAAMLGHEIKNPLSGIRGAAQLLAGEEDAGVRADLSQLIVTEVDRIAALIDRMQDFTDDRPRNLEPANLYPLLAHARQLAQAGFARGIAIEERYDPSLPDVLIDRDAFVQVLVNLLKNAAEALANTPEPRIVIATAYRHGMSASAVAARPRRPLPIEVAVIDNGPGAPPDIADHLFEPFVSGKREGRGLGLPLVEKLLGDMGGIVRYAREGEPPLTWFRILLPRAPRTR